MSVCVYFNVSILLPKILRCLHLWYKIDQFINFNVFEKCKKSNNIKYNWRVGQKTVCYIIGGLDRKLCVQTKFTPDYVQTSAVILDNPEIHF